MYSWDAEARQYLDSLAESFRDSELLEWLHKTISEVWSINMDRYEPTALGDTAGAFGILSADNIRQRALKASREGRGVWSAGVRASNPEGSLQITTGGVNVHILKAPRSGSRIPAWERDFRWDTKSYSRLNAAIRNTRLSPPDQVLAGQGALFEPALDRDYPATLSYSDVFLVWSGEELTGLTAGWLGIPVLGPSPWIAVSQPLWRDESRDGSLSSTSSPKLPVSAVDFDGLDEPEPQIRMKARPSREQLS